MSEVQDLERELFELKQRLSAARRTQAAEPVPDGYMFETADGPCRLSDFFGDHDELLVVHNMGVSCPYCSLWADGFVGLYAHLTTRAGFVLVNADPLDVQASAKAARGWPFPMARDPEWAFARDMGYASDAGLLPGVSALRRLADGGMVRTNHTAFGPGDDFCAVWPMWDLLDGGAGEWHPRGWDATRGDEQVYEAPSDASQGGPNACGCEE